MRFQIIVLLNPNKNYIYKFKVNAVDEKYLKSNYGPVLNVIQLKLLAIYA